MARATQAFHDGSYITEIWILFGIGMIALAARFFVRIRTVGLRGFQGDDYISIFMVCFHVLDATTISLVYYYGANTDFTPAQIEAFTDDQIRDIAFGTKMEMIAWNTYTMLLWSLKGCMLFFFNRLTFGLTEQKMVKGMAVITICTYIGMFLTIMLSCYPFSRNWQVRPLPPLKCSFRGQNFIVCAVLNTVTDAMIMAIPLPLVYRMRVPLRKKLLVALLLCSGIFVITAAIVRVAMTFKSHPSALNINRWGIRETIAGLCAVNAPILKPLFQKSFWVQAAPEPRGRRPSVPTRHRNAKSLRAKMGSVLEKFGAIELLGSDKTNVTATTATTMGTIFTKDDQDATAVELEKIVPIEEEIRRMATNSTSPPHPGIEVDMERGPALFANDGTDIDEGGVSPARQSSGPQAVWTDTTNKDPPH